MSDKILIVDDDPEIIMLLRTVLEFNGMIVDSVESGAEALLKLENEAYRLLISDYLMKEMDGLMLLQEVRSKERLDAMPCILLTLKDLDSEELAKLSKLTATYLRKPFSPNEVLQKIDSLLGA